MAEKWYDGLPDEAFKSEETKAYERAFGLIRDGLDRGLGFDEACAAVQMDDENLKNRIVDDMLKVIIAEEHFARKVPLDTLAAALKVSEDRLKQAKESMFEDIRKTSVDSFYKNLSEGDIA